MTPERVGAVSERSTPPSPASGCDDSRAAVAAFYRAMLRPGSGQIRKIRELTADANGESICFIGETFADTPDMAARPALYRIGAKEGTEPALLREGPVALPRLSATGGHLAFVIPGETGDILHIVAAPGFTLLATRSFAGHVEELAWSPDARRLLARIAGLGADQSGRDGGVMPVAEQASTPILSPCDADDMWRRLWIVDLEGNSRCVSAARECVWEAAWCGNDAVAVVRSADHSENAWYDADLAIVTLADGASQSLYQPVDQIGLPAGSAPGNHVAFVEAVCSDRGLVCGTLRLLDLGHGTLRTLDTGGVDVSSLAFRADGRLHYAGLRSLETVVGDMDVDSGERSELWSSAMESCGVWHPASLPAGPGRALIVREGFNVPPEIAFVSREGVETRLRTGDDLIALAETIVTRSVSWTSTDGMAIDGLLLMPAEDGPFPTIMEVHGGPVLAHRPRWIGHVRTAWLVAQGYAVFHPNPRGSCGRGRDFAAAVRNDMGGLDAEDLLSGLDHLVASGFADPDRLAVTGSSYGGYMAAWLPTLTDRFRAAIAISPISDWRSQHGTSQIGRFDQLFLADPALREERSPILHADKVATPIFLLAGGRDRNTPAGQAQQFHTALLERGVPTQLALYPSGGHSLRDFAIMLDVSARTADWLHRFLA